jgi:hypothetical protein
LIATTAQAEDVLGPVSEVQGLLQSAPPAAETKATESSGAGDERAQHPAREGKRKKRSSSERVKRPGRESATSASYDQLKRSWHAPWTEPEASEEVPNAAPALVLHPVGKTSMPYVLWPAGEQGGFGEGQLAVASQAFGSWVGGPDVSPRLLDLIYHAARHFQVRHVHLVSGVRQDRGGSRHSHGLAADIVLPGVDDEELANYFRAQGFVGVGVYTRAGFVHIDVRDQSFFWIDPSPPDRHYKIRPVRAEEARAADDAALARGQDSFVNPPKLQKALHTRSKRKRAERQAKKPS